MSANDYIRINDSLEIEEIGLNKITIIEEVLHKLDFCSSDKRSDIKIEEILYLVVLKQ
ncbi:11278_t:CDS:1, partial [Cetraspora pellucida]